MAAIGENHRADHNRLIGPPLSLLFVPAGVGVVGHLDKFGSDGAALGVAIIGSTVVAITVGVLTFVGLRKLTGTSHD